MSRMSASQVNIRQHLKASQPEFSQSRPVGWLEAFPGICRVVNCLGATEFRRRLFHMSPALLAFPLPLIPHQAIRGQFELYFLYLATISLFVVAVKLGPLFKRQGEKDWMKAVLGYMIPVVVPLLVFRRNTELGLLTLQIIALGDGSATMGGLMIGGYRLPWNHKKTLAGLICFTVVGSLAATYSYWGEARPEVSIGTAFLICGVAALCAALVESLPIRSNDNLRVGMTAFAVGTAMKVLVS